MFLIGGHAFSGAERQLAELARGLGEAGDRILVVTFYDSPELVRELENVANVTVVSLRKRHRWEVLRFFVRLLRLVRATRPRMIHGYMDVANLSAFVLGKATRTPVVWGLRCSQLELHHFDWLLRVAFRLECWFARHVDLIVANSFAGRRDYVAQGFPSDRTVVIHNGIDTDRFQPDPDGAAAFRRHLALADDTALFGIVGRLAPMKDHATFLEAAAELSRELPDAHFVVIGEGPADTRAAFREKAQQLGLFRRMTWIDRYSDLRAAYSAFDVLVSSSAYGEGFSNVLAEAMACGTPCVATAVGDAAVVVDETGALVPPRNAPQMAAAMLALLRRRRSAPEDVRVATRLRIVQHYNTATMIRRTLAAWRRIEPTPHLHDPTRNPGVPAGDSILPGEVQRRPR